MDRNCVIKINLKVETMNTVMQKSLQLPHKYDGEESCCIFKVPQSLLEINKDAYEPQIVSIGPYHHGKDLQFIEEHKWRYLYGLLQKISKQGDESKSLKSLLNSIVSMESKVRQSYSETIHFSSEDLAQMMVLDGVFMIELFRKFGKINHEHQNDPIFKMVWVLPFLMRDFLRIENQIPFFVLKKLFDESRAKDDTLPSLIFKFFNYGAYRPKEVLNNYADLKGKHLLDVFRKSFLKKSSDASEGNVVDRTNQELSECACLEGKHFLNLFFFKKHLKKTRNDISIEPGMKPYELHRIHGVSLTRNETSDDHISIEHDTESDDDTSTVPIPPVKKNLKESVRLTGNEKSDDDISIEQVSEPDEMNYKVGVALTRNETSEDDTSTQPTEKHLKKTFADNPSFERIQPATKLVIAGVKFKKNRDAKSFLDIKFQKGVLSIPQINLDDFYTHFILNGMIFEQCYSNCSKDFTTYIVFLGCLINTSMDVGLLSDSKIIQNYLGTDKELVKFFNNVGKYVAFDIGDNYLKDVFKEINEYCDSGWHVGWAEFKHTYFDSPWIFISAFAAFVLLCLAGLQTFYTVYPYYYEHK